MLLKLSHVEAKLGQCEQALRWTEQARTGLQGLDGPAAARQIARLAAWYAMVLQLEGRTTEALEWAERTVAEAEAADDPEALGDAYYVMGSGYGELGKDGALAFMERSLEAYQRSGNLCTQADVLTNLGARLPVGRPLGRGAVATTSAVAIESLKIGDTVGAALARINIAEILIDRGEWAEAEALLLETLPVWRASQYRYYLGGCLLLLGRVSLRLGSPRRGAESPRRGQGELRARSAPRSKSRSSTPGSRSAMSPSEMPTPRLELARDMLSRAERLERRGAGGVAARSACRRTRCCMQGDLWGARDALDASLVAARERNDLFEATLTMLSLIELDRLEGVEPPLDMVNESRSLLASLKVRAVPPVPLPATRPAKKERPRRAAPDDIGCRDRYGGLPQPSPPMSMNVVVCDVGFQGLVCECTSAPG